MSISSESCLKCAFKPTLNGLKNFSRYHRKNLFGYIKIELKKKLKYQIPRRRKEWQRDMNPQKDKTKKPTSLLLCDVST